MSGSAREVIVPSDGARPMGPYSPGIRVGDMVFASGTTGMDPDAGSLVEGGVAAETGQALANLSKVLEAGGSSLGRVVKTTVFMTNLQEFATMNAVYGEVFTADPPARSTIQVAALPGGAAVEIEAIAWVEGG
ncbi:MAG: RidA family protein [Anaerolineae bacterium]|nr:MAG: RidA family protein [Anaerolineae bacterium]